MVENFNVAIIGGGPAGTSAAIRCALAGARVVLLERSEFPRHRPGETLHPGIEPLLKQLGVWDRVERVGFVRHAGVQVRVGGRESFQAFGSDATGEWLGLQAWRAEFDLARCVSAPAGLGYFLCGDAAAVLDPASSHGVLKSVMSGIYAGYLIEQVRSHVRPKPDAAAEYSDWLTSWFRHNVDALKRHYSDMRLNLDGFANAVA